MRRVQGSNLLELALIGFQDQRITVLPTLRTYIFYHLRGDLEGSWYNEQDWRRPVVVYLNGSLNRSSKEPRGFESHRLRIRYLLPCIAY